MQSAKSGEILISKSVLDRTDGLDAYYQPEPIEPILLKGKTKAIEAYRIAKVFSEFETEVEADLAVSPELPLPGGVPLVEGPRFLN